jgi:hypothetical protein
VVGGFWGVPEVSRAALNLRLLSGNSFGLHGGFWRTAIMGVDDDDEDDEDERKHPTKACAMEGAC